MSEDVEIHFDEEQGNLELACGPDAFAEYRDFVHEQILDFTEIPIDSVTEIVITDTKSYVARRDSRSQFPCAIALIFAVAILALAIVGAVELWAKWIG